MAISTGLRRSSLLGSIFKPVNGVLAGGGLGNGSIGGLFLLLGSPGMTISSTIAGPFVLTAASDPLTITSTGAVLTSVIGADAIVGTGSTGWIITNDGLVEASAGLGISLGAGTVTNQGAGVITGAVAGVRVSGGAGSVVNAGTIVGGTTLGYAVQMNAGGMVSNTGLLLGAEDGVAIQGRVGTILNSGTIHGTVDDGVGLFNGGRVSNAAGGRIQGDGATAGAAVFITGASGSLYNAGVLTAAHLGVLLAHGGAVTNSGDVDAPRGIYITGGAGQLSNTGTISGSAVASVYFSTGGRISNTGKGVISGGLFGAFIGGGTGLVINSGLISAAMYDGVVFDHGGTVRNVAGGTITGGSNGVYVKYTATGSITNAGTITSTRSTAVDLAGGGSVQNLTAGLVQGAQFGVFVTKAPGTITNSATIVGTAYDGVALGAGGSVVNNGSGSVLGGSNGVYFEAGGAGTLTNAGLIMGGRGAGADLAAGGDVVNRVHATLSGHQFGLFVSGGAGQVANFGVVTGAVYSGIEMTAGGTLTNGSSGSIRGSSNGVYMGAGGAGTIINAGTIGAGTGVDLGAGGTLVNDAKAHISASGIGVFVSGGAGTVDNGGTISGGSSAVLFSGASADRVILRPGGVFAGAVTGGSGSNTLELAAGSGSVAGIKTGSFVNFANLQVDAGGQWTASGADSVANVLNDGTLTVAASLDISGSIDPASDGTFILGTSSQFEVAAAVGAGDTIYFVGGGHLVVDQSAQFGAFADTSQFSGPLLSNFTTNDSIDLADFGFTGANFGFNSAAGSLTLTNASSQVAELQFQPAGLGVGSFSIASDGVRGVVITHT